jgi:hypothetical protein
MLQSSENGQTFVQRAHVESEHDQWLVIGGVAVCADDYALVDLL